MTGAEPLTPPGGQIDVDHDGADVGRPRVLSSYGGGDVAQHVGQRLALPAGPTESGSGQRGQQRCGKAVRHGVEDGEEQPIVVEGVLEDVAAGFVGRFDRGAPNQEAPQVIAVMFQCGAHRPLGGINRFAVTK